MKNNFQKLTKQIRFYVFIISIIAIIIGIILEGIYTYEFNKILTVAKNTNQYSYVDKIGHQQHTLKFNYDKEDYNNKQRRDALLKRRFNEILNDKFGRNYVDNYNTRAAQLFFLFSLPLLISGFMCYLTLFPLKKKTQTLTEEQIKMLEREERINRHTIGEVPSINDTTSKVTCPYCKSTNVSKIGSFNRMTSIGFWGLASNKIGKQWHCNDCNSNF